MTEYTLNVDGNELDVLKVAIEVYADIVDDNIVEDIFSEIQSMYKDDRVTSSQVGEKINELLDKFKATITLVERVNNLK